MKVFFISFIVLVIDQVSKFLVKSMMALRESIPVLGNTLKLTYIENDGMAFGIAIGNKYVFNLFSIVAAGAILYFLIRMRKDHTMPRVALAIIFGGAIGNLIDRLLYGRVVDFFDMNIPNIPSFDLGLFTTPAFARWPIFNVADIAVSLGMMLLIFTIFTSQDPWYEHEASSGAEGSEPVTDTEN